jgi:hypothetical protein
MQMLAKAMITVLTAALAVMVVRQIGRNAERAKARVRKGRDSNRDPRVTTLREDPDTGVFHPVDRD